MVSNSNNETNFPHILLLTNRQILSLRKTFANHTLVDIKLSKAQLTKMQKEGFLKFLMPFLKSGLPLLKSGFGCYCITNRCCNKQKMFRIMWSYNINNF